MDPLWLTLLTPLALLTLLVAVNRLEQWLVVETLADQIKGYLRDPESPDNVESAVSQLLERRLAHMPPG